MSLNIKVNHVRKNKTFKGGDHISGNVIATGPISEDQTKVTILMKGKSQTEIKVRQGQSKRKYTDKVKFFRYTGLLYQGPFNIDKDASISWPFAFDLPMHTEPKGGFPAMSSVGLLDRPTGESPILFPPRVAGPGAKYCRTTKPQSHTRSTPN